jgi:hypothetical protein
MLVLLLQAVCGTSALAGKDDPIEDPSPEGTAELLPTGDVDDVRFVDGRLGVGTSNPANKFEVWGNTWVAATPSAYNFLKIGDPIGGFREDIPPITLFGSAQSNWRSVYLGIDSPDGIFHIYPYGSIHGKFNRLNINFDTSGTGIMAVYGNAAVTGELTSNSIEVQGNTELAAQPNAKRFVKIGDPIGGKDNTVHPITLFGSEQVGWDGAYMGIDSPTGIFRIYPYGVESGRFNKLLVQFDGPGELNVLGNGIFSGTVTTGSSRELKKNISELAGDEAIEALMSLIPVKYNYKTNEEELELGFIAEDVPDLVARNDRKSLSPMDFAALSVSVIQKQQEQINEQRLRIEALDALVRKLIDQKQ